MFRKSGRGAAFCPVARTEGLSVTTSGDETLVYDKENFVIHRLDAESSSVWRLADGTRDLTTIAIESGVGRIEETISSLIASGLVRGDPIRRSLLTRRRVLAGAAGAAAAGTFIAVTAATPHEGAYCGTSYMDTTIPCNGSHANARWQCDSGVWNPKTNQVEYSWHCT